MAYNIVEANGETLIDLTSDTVTADTLISGRTAHLASGERVTGTFIPVAGVKGNAESTYRTGNVNLTPANLGLDPLGYYGIGGRTTNTTANPWVLVAETTALNNNNTGITLLFDYTFTEANNATSTGTGILSVSVRVNANGAIITNRSYAKWLTKMNELNNDDVIITYNNSTKSLQIWGKSDNPYKVMRVRPLSGSDRFNLFDISKWTFTTSLNTNMYESYPTGDGITVLTPTCDMQEQVNYNTNNGVKNLLNLNWFKTNAKSGQLGTVESLNTETGSITGYTPASITTAYSEISIMDISNQILENGKKYILSCTVDSLTNNGIFGFRQVSNNAFIKAINITKTGKFITEYTHDSSIPVFISFCINTTGTSADKRIALSNVMLREATIEDDTFQPYAKSNAELTQDLDDISGELDCLLIQAALVNNEVIIQNTSDFTSELYSKYFSYTKPKFAILKLQITSNTHYYKALINSLSVSQGNLMEASFMTMATGEYIYNFTWLRTVTVGTPTVIRKALNLGS